MSFERIRTAKMTSWWLSLEDLACPVRFRFHLRHGRLYSFWVSSQKSGASGGYVATGGPGFTAPTDTVGVAAYEAAKRLETPVQ